MINKIKKVISFFLILSVLLINSYFAYDYYTVVNIKSQEQSNIQLYGVYLCRDSSCTSVSQEVNAVMYDYSKISNCFSDYNRDDIDSCINSGYLGTSVSMEAGKEKLVVLKIETPDKQQHYFDIVFNPDNQVSYTAIFLVNDWTSYSVNYLNDVYWYQQDKYNPAILEFKPIDLSNKKGAVISYFNISNKVEVKQPLFIEVPAELDSAICTELKKKTPYYVPEEVLNIETKVSLTIKDKSGNIIYTNSKELEVNPDVCNVNYNFQWTPQEIGNLTVTLKAEVTDPRVINALSDQVQQEIEVFDPNQQFCYTNLKNIVLGDLDNNDPWTLENDEAIKLGFDVLSGENDGTGTIVPKQTYWEVYVDGIKISSGIENDIYAYKQVLVDLTNKLNEGQHNLMIRAKALNCDYTNNQEATFTKTINILQDDDQDLDISNETNHAPEILNFQINKTEGEAPLTTTFSFQVYDQDKDPLKVVIAYDGCLTDGCNYEVIDAQSGQTIEKTFTYPEQGIYTLKILVNDSKKINILTKTIVVKAQETTTNPPEIKEFSYSWEDIDKDNLIDTNEEVTFNATVNCLSNCSAKFSLFDLNGNIIDQKTLLVTGEQTLNFGSYTLQEGKYKAELSLDNGKYNTYKFLTFNVVGNESNEDINHAPEIIVNVSSITAYVGENVKVNIIAQDEDNDSISLQLSLVDETNSIIDYYNKTGSGTIEYTYSRTFENKGTYTLVIEAYDSFGYHVSKNVLINILENNQSNEENVVVVDNTSEIENKDTNFVYEGSPVDLKINEEEENIGSIELTTIKQELNKLLEGLIGKNGEEKEMVKAENSEERKIELKAITIENNNKKKLLIGVVTGASLLLLLLLVFLLI